DLNIPTSKEEQEEYIRWKKEREQIDRERVARHKNAKGQWRRAWDMDKTENISYHLGLYILYSHNTERKEGEILEEDNLELIQEEKRGKDKKAKNVPAMSSKAKGIDRLTGRARRLLTQRWRTSWRSSTPSRMLWQRRAKSGIRQRTPRPAGFRRARLRTPPPQQAWCCLLPTKTTRLFLLQRRKCASQKKSFGQPKPGKLQLPGTLPTRNQHVSAP
ncbi:unnamed protein product, partial [Tetraodon nigroviridis]